MADVERAGLAGSADRAAGFVVSAGAEVLRPINLTPRRRLELGQTAAQARLLGLLESDSPTLIYGARPGREPWVAVAFADGPGPPSGVGAHVPPDRRRERALNAASPFAWRRSSARALARQVAAIRADHWATLRLGPPGRTGMAPEVYPLDGDVVRRAAAASDVPFVLVVELLSLGRQDEVAARPAHQAPYGRPAPRPGSSFSESLDWRLDAAERRRFLVRVRIGGRGALPTAAMDEIRVSLEGPATAPGAAAVDASWVTDGLAGADLGGDGWPSTVSVLNHREAAALVALPVDPRTRPAADRLLQMPPGLGAPELVFGRAVGANRRVGLQWSDLPRHVAILGASGSGKSTLVAALAMQVIAARNQAVFVIDAHGSLIEGIGDSLAESELERVVAIDPGDEAGTASWCPFVVRAQLEADQLADLLVAYAYEAVERVGPGAMGPIAADHIRATVKLVALKPEGGTVHDVVGALRDRALLQELFEAHGDRIDESAARTISMRLSMNAKDDSEQVAYISAKLADLDVPQLRAVLGRRPPSFDFGSAITGQKIVLVRLSAGGLGQEAVRAFVLLFKRALWNTVQARGPAVPEMPGVTLIVDEASRFVSATDAVWLAEGRKHKASLVLSTQSLGQLRDGDVFGALAANAATVIAYRVGAVDASMLSRMLVGDESLYQELIRQPNFEAVARLPGPGGLPLEPFRMAGPRPLRGNRGLRYEAALESSRRRHGSLASDQAASDTRRASASGDRPLPRRLTAKHVAAALAAAGLLAAVDSDGDVRLQSAQGEERPFWVRVRDGQIRFFTYHDLPAEVGSDAASRAANTVNWTLRLPRAAYSGKGPGGHVALDWYIPSAPLTARSIADAAGRFGAVVAQARGVIDEAVGQEHTLAGGRQRPARRASDRVARDGQ